MSIDVMSQAARIVMLKHKVSYIYERSFHSEVLRIFGLPSYFKWINMADWLTDKMQLWFISVPYLKPWYSCKLIHECISLTYLSQQPESRLYPSINRSTSTTSFSSLALNSSLKCSPDGMTFFLHSVPV